MNVPRVHISDLYTMVIVLDAGFESRHIQRISYRKP